MVNNLQFNGQSITTSQFTPRHVINFIPSVYNTDAMKNFTSATWDHWFQPGLLINLDGYIGNRPMYFKNNDVYIAESNPSRKFYQLIQSMVSAAPNGNSYNAVLCYDDYISYLKANGAIVKNHNTLFGDTYLTWCPPVDLDKLINFSNYVWIKNGPPVIEVIGPYIRYIVNDTTRTSYPTPVDSNGKPIPIVDPNDPAGNIPMIDVYVDENGDGSDYKTYLYNYQYILNRDAGTITFVLGYVPNNDARIKIILTEYQTTDPNRSVEWTAGPYDPNLPSNYPPSGVGLNIDGSTKPPLQVYNTPRNTDGSVKTIHTPNELNNIQNYYPVVVRVDGIDWVQNTDYIVDPENFIVLFNGLRLPGYQSILNIYLNTDIGRYGLGNSSFSFTGFTASSGMRVVLINDWNTIPVLPVKSNFNNIDYIIEGVGTSIQIINDQDNIIYITDPTDANFLTNHTDLQFGWDSPNVSYYTTRGAQQYTFTNGNTIVFMNDADQTNYGSNNAWVISGVGTTNGIILRQISYFDPRATDSPEYHVLQRGCIDNNPWALRNRWFHKDLVDLTTLTSTFTVASRPILEFNKDIQLYNYGVIRRASVDLVCQEYANIVTTIYGRTGDEANLPAIVIDGYQIDWLYVLINCSNHMRVLFMSRKPENQYLNNMVYQISTRYPDGSDVDVNNIDPSKGTPIMVISIESDGVNADGKPYYQEILGVASGINWGNTEVYYDGTEWVLAQSHPDTDTIPLFQLYDWKGNKLQDSSIYTLSNFAGNPLFGFNVAATNPIDTVLNLRVSHDNNGQILFENFVSTDQYTYQTNNTQITIPGYYFYFIYTDKLGQTGVYSNNWYKSSNILKQYLVQQVQIIQNQKLITMDVVPDSIDDENLIVTQNYTILTLNKDYFVQNNQILIPNANYNDIITLNIYNSRGDGNTGSSLYYQIPKNLSANPTWKDPSVFSIGQIYPQISEIMANNPAFTGQLYSSNNWRDIAHQYSYGTEIIQSYSPLLKPMLFASLEQLDLIKAIEFASSEYMKIRNQLLQKLYTMINSNSMIGITDPDVWLNLALTNINTSKSNSSPFWLSMMGVENNKPTWIPATPAFFGILPLIQPEYWTDTSTKTETTYLKSHDGSLISLYGDIRDDIMYTLEQRIYNNANNVFKNSDLGIIPVIDIVSGRFRNSDYSWWDFQQVLRPYFERWCIDNKIDYSSNTTFDPNNRWTWNWGSLYDSNNNQLPGYWRNIYRFYYDTDCPHTNPWEMFGFNTQPTWWVSRYGPAPWTSANTILWSDVATGTIYDGNRKGIDLRYARPNISQYIPVSLNGSLLDPYQIGIVSTLPSMVQASANWEPGDGGPVETAWIRSSSYRFAVSIVLYLMKPAKFVELCWQPDMIITINPGTSEEQFLRIDTGTRVYNDLYVHGETVNGKIIKNLGIQQWISDYLTSLGKNITDNFGSLLRNLNVHLTYRMSGFTNINSLLVTSEIFGDMNSGDIIVDMYQTPPIKTDFYGGFIIEWNGNGYLLNGYDTINPYFTIYLPMKQSRYKIISADGVTNKINSWLPNTYYALNVIITYQNSYYQCIKSHTSAAIFETVYWQQISKPQSAYTSQVFMYQSFDTSQEIIIPYGSYYRTPQEIVDVIFGWEAYLKSRGWIFSDTESLVASATGFSDSVIEFLKWNQINWTPGNFIALSPANQYICYQTDVGEILNLDYAVHGSYSIIDRAGAPISLRNLRIIRSDGKIVLIPTTLVGIFGVRIMVVTIEHILIFNNKTIFGDIVYDPIYNSKQTRLKLQGQKSSNWQGRINAPGFVISNNVLVPNFETSAEDFRNLFEVSGSSNTVWNQYARHNLAFMETDYFSNFGMSTTTQFEFYRGMISHKGTPSVFNRLMRNTNINPNQNIQFLEEWAVLVGSFGEDWKTANLSFSINRSDIKMVPQVVSFTTRLWDENVDGYPNSRTKVIFKQIAGSNNTFTLNPNVPYLILNVTNSISIDSIEIRIINSFDGILPYLEIGTEDNNSDLITVSLSQVGILNEQFTNKIYSPGTAINAYFINDPGNIGTVSILVKWSYTSAYWNSLVPAEQNFIPLYDIISKQQSIFFREDPRWNQRPLNQIVSFKTTEQYLMRKNNTLSAGYVNMNDIDWFAPKWFDFISIYNDQRTVSPPQSIDKSISILSTTIGNNIQEWQIVPTLSSGLYRITKIVVNVTQAWRPESKPKLTLYSKLYNTDPNGTEIDIASMVGFVNGDPLTISNNYITYPYVFIHQIKNVDTSIRLRFSQTSIIGLRGQMNIIVSVERINNQILPGQMAWCYNTGTTGVSWQVYKLYETGLNASVVYASGNDQQGGLVAINVDAINPPIPVSISSGADNPNQGYIQSVFNNINSNSLVILDGLALDNQTNFNGIFNPIFKSQYVAYLDAGTTYAYNILPIYGETGFYITDIEINLLTPFNGSSTLTILAGTETLVYPVLNEPLFTTLQTVRPQFTDLSNIYIDVFDPSLTIAEYEAGKLRRTGVIYDDQINIRVIRDGHIFLAPTAISVFDPGDGYQLTPNINISTGRATSPLVTDGGTSAVLRIRTIAGQEYQEGVNDKLIGPITDISVINGGSGYTYAKVNILGRGNGASTHNVITLGGVIQPWNINNSMSTQGNGYGWDTQIVVTTYGGPSLTTAATINGQVQSIVVSNGGSGFITKPAIVIVGGGGYGAKALPVVRNGTIVKVFVDPDDPDWTNAIYGTLGDPLGELAGMNPSMVSMGVGYVTAPQVLVTTNNGNSQGVVLVALLDYTISNITITSPGATGYFDPNAMSVVVDAPTSVWALSNPSKYTAKATIKFDNLSTDLNSYLPKTTVHWQITRLSDNATAWSNQPFKTNKNGLTEGTSWENVSGDIHFYQAIELALTDYTGYWLDNINLDLKEVRANLYVQNPLGQWIFTPDENPLSIEETETWTFSIVQTTPWSQVSSINYYDTPTGIVLANTPLVLRNISCTITVLNTIADNPNSKDFYLQYPESISKIIRGTANTDGTYNPLYTSNYSDSTEVTINLPGKNSTVGSVLVIVNYGYNSGFELYNVQGSPTDPTVNVIGSRGNPDGTSTPLDLAAYDLEISNGQTISFNQTSVPFQTSTNIHGGDLFVWVPCRFADWTQALAQSSMPPKGYWDTGDIIYLDNGLTIYEKIKGDTAIWKIFECVNIPVTFIQVKSFKDFDYDEGPNNPDNLSDDDFRDESRTETPSTPSTQTPGTPGTGPAPTPTVTPAPTPTPTSTPSPVEHLYNMIISGLDTTVVSYVIFYSTGEYPTINQTNWIDGSLHNTIVPNVLYSLTFNLITTLWELRYAGASDVLFIRNIPSDGSNFSIKWYQKINEEQKVDVSLIQSSWISDASNPPQVQQYIELFDPIKNVLPGIIEREIYYKSDSDPAFYNSGAIGTNTLNPWGPLQVGRLWWDLSNLIYIDYEQSDLLYRAKYWGKLAPRISINAYEWIESPVTPNEYYALTQSNSDYTGYPKYPLNEGYSEQTRWNDLAQNFVTYYYFWVEYKTTSSPLIERKMTCFEVAQTLQDPTGNDLSWFAIISSSAALFSNISQYISDFGGSIQINTKNSNSYYDGEHNQWKLIKRGDNSINIDQNLWQKMSDSLVGWDNNVEAVNSTMLGCALKFLDWTTYTNQYIQLYVNGNLEIPNADIPSYQVISDIYLSDICNILNQKDQYFATWQENTLYISVSEDIRSYAYGWKVEVKLFEANNVASFTPAPDPQWIQDMPIYVTESNVMLLNNVSVPWISVTNLTNLLHDGLIQVNGIWYTYEYSTVYEDLLYIILPASNGGYGIITDDGSTTGILILQLSYGTLEVNMSSLIQYDSNHIELMPNSYAYFINATVVNILSEMPNNDTFAIQMSDNTVRIINIILPTAQSSSYEVITGYIYFQQRVHRLYNVSSSHNTLLTIGSEINQQYQKSNPRIVPDPNLPSNEMYGNLFFPRQTWFKVNFVNGIAIPSRDARRDFVDSFNNIVYKTDIPMVMERLDWSQIFLNGTQPNIDPQPNISEYSYHTTDMFDRNSYSTSLEKGQRILVDGVLDTNGFWTLWEYDPEHYLADSYGFWLVKAQKWRLLQGEFWDYIDWYASGYSATNYPLYTYDTIDAMNAAILITPNQFGQNIIQVNNSGDGTWIWYVYNNSVLQIVGKENGTIILTSLFYDSKRVAYGFNNYNIADIPSRDGSWELSYILSNLYSLLLKFSERNQIFFDMAISSMKVNYNTDWIFKTSFMYINGSATSLIQSPVILNNLYDDLVKYIDTVKPYHVKIRENGFSIASPIDIGSLHTTDFDNPIYFDISTSKYRNLDITNLYDLAIFKTVYPWQDWYQNFQKTQNDNTLWNSTTLSGTSGYENYNPIRKINTTIQFNRISPSAINGWDAAGIGWDAPMVFWTSNGTATDFRDLDKQLRLPYSAIPDPRLANDKYHSYRWVAPPCKVGETNCCNETTTECCREIIATINQNGVEVPNTQILWLTPGYDPSQFANIPNPFKPGNRFKDTVVSSFTDRNALTIPTTQPDGSFGCYVVSGTIVAVTNPTLTYWIWQPISQVNQCVGNWVQFESTKWDNLSQGGMADIIQEYYVGTLGLPNVNTPDLIDGGAYQKTIIDGGALELTEIEDLNKVLSVKQTKMNNLITRILKTVVVEDSHGNPVPIQQSQIPAWVNDPTNTNVLAKLYKIFELEINTIQSEIEQYTYDFPWQYFNTPDGTSNDIIELLTERKQQTMEILNYDLVYNPSDPTTVRQKISALQDKIFAIRLRGWWDESTIAQQSIYTVSVEPSPLTYPQGYIPNNDWPVGQPQNPSFGKYGYQGIRRILANINLVNPNRTLWVTLYNNISLELQNAEQDLAMVYKPWDSIVILQRMTQLNAQINFEQFMQSILNSYNGIVNLTAEQKQIISDQFTISNQNIGTYTTELNWLSPRVFSPISIDDSSTIVSGDSFIQPMYGTRPQENVSILARSPLSINIWLQQKSPIVGNITNAEILVRSNPVFDTLFKVPDDSKNPTIIGNGDVNGDGDIGAGESFEIDFKITNETFVDASNVKIHDARIIIVTGSNSVSDYGPYYGFLYNNNSTVGTVPSNTTRTTTYDQDLCVDIPANASTGDSFNIQLIIDSDGSSISLQFGPFVIGSIVNGQIYEPTIIANLGTLSAATPIGVRPSVTYPYQMPKVWPLPTGIGHIPACKLFKDGNDFWEQNRYVNTNVVLNEMVLQPGFGQNSISVRWNGNGIPQEDALHNPDLPHTRFLENVKSNNVMFATTLNDGTSIVWQLDGNNTISLAFNAYNKMISGNPIFAINEPISIYDPNDTSDLNIPPTPRRFMKGIISGMNPGDNTTNPPTLPYISIMVDISKDGILQGSGTASSVVIENDKMFKSPGAIWINNEKITYWTRTPWQSDGTCTLGSDALPIQRGVGNTASGITEQYVSVKYASDGRTTKWNIPSISNYVRYGYDLDISTRIQVIIHTYGPKTDPAITQYKWTGSYPLSASDYQVIKDAYGKPSYILLNSSIPVATYRQSNNTLANAPNIQVVVALITSNDSLLYQTYTNTISFIGKKNSGYGVVTDEGNGLYVIAGTYGTLTVNLSNEVMYEGTPNRIIPYHYIYILNTVLVNNVSTYVVDNAATRPLTETFVYQTNNNVKINFVINIPPKAPTYNTVNGYIRPTNDFYASHLPIDVNGVATPVYDCSMMHTVPTNTMLDIRRPPWARIYPTNFEVRVQGFEPQNIKPDTIVVGLLWYDIYNRTIKMATSVNDFIYITDATNADTLSQNATYTTQGLQKYTFADGDLVVLTNDSDRVNYGPQKGWVVSGVGTNITLTQTTGVTWFSYDETIADYYNIVVVGIGAPTSSNPPYENGAKAGNYYQDVTTNIIYQYDGTNWNQSSNVNTMLIIGNGTPSSVVYPYTNALAGNYYQDPITNTIYQCISMTWSIIMMVNQGPPSATWPYPNPVKGNYYQDEKTVILYQYDGTNWNKVSDLNLIYTPILSKLILTGGHETIHDFNLREAEWKQFLMNWS